jgi:hypothetical protein
MGPGAIRLMRAIKQRHPVIEAGMVVDPYTLALDAGLDADHVEYHAALDELVDADVLRRAVEAEAIFPASAQLNPNYQITAQGERAINDVGE